MMGRPPKGDRIVSIDKHPKGWRLRYVINGFARCEYRKTKESIQKRARYHQDRIDGKIKDKNKKPSLDLGDGDSADWAKIMWWAAKSVLADKQDEDARAVARTIAQLAASAHKHMDLNKILQEQEELRDMVKTITQARKNASRSFKRAKTVEAATKREEPLN